MVCQLYHLAADVGHIKHGLLNRPKQLPVTQHHGSYEIIQTWPYEGIPKHYRHWTNLWHCHKNNEYLAFLLCKYLLIATYILQILIFALLSVELCRFTNENNIEPIGTQHYQEVQKLTNRNAEIRVVDLVLGLDLEITVVLVPEVANFCVRLCVCVYVCTCVRVCVCECVRVYTQPQCAVRNHMQWNFPSLSG